MNRRKFLQTMGGIVAAPAIIKIEHLMPVKPYNDDYYAISSRKGWSLSLKSPEISNLHPYSQDIFIEQCRGGRMFVNDQVIAVNQDNGYRDKARKDLEQWMQKIFDDAMRKSFLERSELHKAMES